MLRRTLLAGLLALASLAGCTIDTGGTDAGPSSGGSSSGGATASSGTPEIAALYGTLPAATPDKLAGVWSSVTKAETGDADVRFRFASGKLTVGVRCTYAARPGEMVTTGGSTTLATTDLDAGFGQFRIGERLSFRAQEGELECRSQFENLSYSFQITGTTLLLGATEAPGTAALTKVGD